MKLGVGVLLASGLGCLLAVGAVGASDDRPPEAPAVPIAVPRGSGASEPAPRTDRRSTGDSTALGTENPSRTRERPQHEPELDPELIPGVPGDAVEARAPAEPSMPLSCPPGRPTPWQTAVRLRVLGPGSVGFGSGTIIRSTPDESLILACAHTFLVGNAGVPPHPRDFPQKIQVDLFDGKLPESGPARVRPVESVPGELIDRDFAANLALVRIRPGRELPASPIVPPGWKPAAGMAMVTVGCSDGNAPSIWSTHITNPSVRGRVDNANYEAIACDRAPAQGRSGGGLFTDDGRLAGVCNYAIPSENRGHYATPAAIHRLLARNKSIMLDVPAPSAPAAPGEASGAAGWRPARRPIRDTTPLVIRVANTESVRLGSEVRFAIDVTNTGDRPLRNVIVRVHLDGGLEHATQGPTLELSVADLPSYGDVLRPGETIALPPLIARAAEFGNHECVVIASAADLQIPNSAPAVGQVRVTPGPDHR